MDKPTGTAPYVQAPGNPIIHRAGEGRTIITTPGAGAFGCAMVVFCLFAATMCGLWLFAALR